MNQESSGDQAQQTQDNVVKDIHFGGDNTVFTFAPVQIGTKIETQIIQISVDKITQKPLTKASPYKGLKRFNFGDRDRFFGRDHLIAKLFTAVNQSSFSLVLGASGSGKSSVVRAGLIPELKKSLDAQKFYDFIFTPNLDPFESLYRCLLNEEKDYSFSKSKAEIALQREENTFSQVISALKKPEEKWLIFIDQFEELFTTCSEIDIQKAFIEGIVQVANAGDSSIRIVLAMRADFLEKLSSYATLGTLANQNNIHLVTGMYPDELRQAIEQPAAKHGIVFEEGLVEQIIKEVEGQSGYLPLLQYTLNLLWESECKTAGTDGHSHIEDRTLNRSSYMALEGVRGALQKRVDEIYQNLNQDEQLATRQIFMNLVDFVESESGSKTVGKRAYRDEFEGSLKEATLNKFINDNLLISNYERLTEKDLQVGENLVSQNRATVEIAHEILISSWNDLKKWLEEEKEAIILKRWLSGELRRWQKIKLQDESKAKDELLKGSRLGQILEFRDKNSFERLGGLSPRETAFIDASVRWRDFQQAEREHQRLKELEAEVAIKTEKERNQILDQALSEAQVTITDAQTKRRQIIRRGLIALAGITVVTVAASIAAIAASKKLIEAQQGTQLEQAGNSARQQFAAGELEALLSAMRSGQTLKALVKDRPLQDYPTISPLFALQTILGNIHELNQFTGSQRPIRSVSLSRDGQQIATGDTDGTIQLWTLSGKQLAKWEAHQGAVNHIEFSPNRQQLATVGTDGFVVLWEPSGKQVKKWLAHVAGGANYFSFSLDGTKIATAGGDKSIRLWDLSSRRRLAQWKAVSGEFDGVRSLAISPDGQRIVSAGDDGAVKLWSLAGKQLAQFTSRSKSILSVSFSPNGQLIAAAGEDSVARLWNLAGKQVAELKGHQGTITSIKFSPQGQSLVTTGGDDGIVKIWNLSGQEIANLRGHQGAVWSASFSRDGRNLATAGGDGIVHLWSLVNKAEIQFQANQRDINSVSFSPNGQEVVAVGDDGMIRLWDLSGRKKREWEARRGALFSVSFSPDGQRLIVSGDNNRVRIWSTSGEQMTLLDKHQGSVKSVSFSSDGQSIVTAGADGTARLWRVSGEEIAQLKGHEGEVTSAVFSPDNKLIATTGADGADGTARIWNLVGQEQAKLLGHRGRVNSLRFNPDGQRIATAGADGTIRIWDLHGQQQSEFYSYQTAVNSLSFSPDGQRIATAGADGTVRIWDTLGRQIAEFQGDGNPFWSVSFSPNGQQIAAAASKGTVYVWSAKNLDNLVTQGCQWLDYYLKSHPEIVKEIEVCQQQ